MGNTSIQRRMGRIRRKKSIRKRVHGTAERPRLSVFRSSKHIYVQAVNDLDGKTIATSSTLSKDLRGEVGDLDPKKAAAAVGKAIAGALLAKSVKTVVFDRNGYHYHGRVKALADGARDGGLTF